MNILLILIPLTLLGLLVAVAMFFWAVNHQQFDDLDNPGAVPLLEDTGHDEPRDDPASSDVLHVSTTMTQADEPTITLPADRFHDKACSITR